MSQPYPPAIFIMGPTASGKTGLALALAETFPVEIISVDSALVYQGMDIGTAKPSAEELAVCPHYLIDFLDPIEPYSAARFRQDALRLMDEITARGKIPLLVGGTMLYYRALEQGLSQLPEADNEIRARLDREMKEHGLQYLHQRLADVDPESAQRIHATDPQRIQRALEVYELTGKSLSDHYREQEEYQLPYRILRLALLPAERVSLHQRIEKRFDDMLANGLIEEVQRLYERGDLDPSMPSIRAVGYRQVWAYLEGEYDEETLRHKGIVATRQLAKRQMTWLRSMKGLTILNSENLDLDYIKWLISKFISDGRSPSEQDD
jgi:tRNA dimethylallyltransferase